MKKTNKDWGYLGIRNSRKPAGSRNGASAIKCAHYYKLDGSGHGFCIHCGREVQFPYDGRGEMQVLKEGNSGHLSNKSGNEKRKRPKGDRG